MNFLLKQGNLIHMKVTSTHDLLIEINLQILRFPKIMLSQWESLENFGRKSVTKILKNFG